MRFSPSLAPAGSPYLVLYTVLMMTACGGSDAPSRGGDPSQLDAGGTEPCLDQDGDGVCNTAQGASAKDCDDRDLRRFPGAAEECNGLDDNCDGEIDETGGACDLTCQAPADGCDVPKQLVAGPGHACVGTEQGRIYCWGSNRYGGLGVGELSHSATPVLMPGIQGYKQLVPGGTCALREADVVCWGDGSSQPVAMPLPTNLVALVTLQNQLCWLDTAGAVSCRPLLASYTASADGLLSSVKQVAAGSHKLCGLRNDGTVSCLDYRLTTAPKPQPLAETGVTMVSVGLDDVVCTKSPRGLVCDGEVIAGNAAAVEVVSSSTHACARGEDGRVACWRGKAPSISGARSLVLGADFGCVLATNNVVQCWGRRQNGQLGDGVTGPQASETALVKLKPGAGFPYLGATVLGKGTLGACDNLSDLFSLARSDGLHASISSCREECAGRLDVGACFETCSKQPISASCQACFITFADCAAAGGSCYEQLRTCVGFAPEFLGAYGGPPDLTCEQAGGCSRERRGHGQACLQSAECLSDNCQRHPYGSQDEKICLARDGSYCDERASHCECDESQSYCGTCSSGGRIASQQSSYSEPGACYRKCTQNADICESYSVCKPFSNSSEKFCD